MSYRIGRHRQVAGLRANPERFDCRSCFVVSVARCLVGSEAELVRVDRRHAEVLLGVGRVFVVIPQRRFRPPVAGDGARIDAGVGRTEQTDSEHTASRDADARPPTAAVAAAADAAAAVARDAVDGDDFPVFDPDRSPVASSVSF